MPHTRSIALAAMLALAAGAAAAQNPRAAAPSAAPPALSAITREELRRDLFAMASDSMRGREGATQDELRASVWVAERARQAGMLPAGDDGTYFQFFPLRRIRQTAASTVAIGGVPLALWEDAVLLSPVSARVDAQVTRVEGAGAATEGRVVVARLRAPSRVPPRGVSLWEWRYAMSAMREQSTALRAGNPAAIVLVADTVAAVAFGRMQHWQREGLYLLDEPGNAVPATGGPPVFLVRPEVMERLAEGARFTADLAVESFVYPSVNVVARVPGTDPRLRAEHVVFSGHQDHDGIGEPVNGDSIWNGADDNATVSVALLAIGRAFVRRPGRRSALFVWHGAEERGLLGSRWYSARPTVPKESLVAVLNGDMIGRNHPDSAALLGSIPPHRNSTALVEMALEANRRHTRFLLDNSWDDPAHPENWYFRSDHLPYAREGVPAIFFTTLLHPDYHTPEDEPERIDIAKLTRMTQWMYATGWAVANAAQRPRVDPGFRLER
ncbi:MAG TPA: M28 family peptidase [Longimicrobium sp.]|jgi:hypothetical protein